jgi:NAD+ synthase (glutamine-hydrolysing)
MRITICQLNPTPGDIDGNTGRMVQTLERASADKADLAVFPEMFVQGYPPRDLLERASFVKQGLAALERLCNESMSYPGLGILTGMAMPHQDGHGKGLSNSAVLIRDGGVVFHQNKTLLPTYDVFDESRYFDAARGTDVYAFKDEVLGITICEDAWNDPALMPRRLYEQDPVEKLAAMGATVLINVSGSPFHATKERLRFELMRRHAQRHHLPFVFVNQVGGNDELLFDGNSMALDADGALRLHLGAFREAVETVDTHAFGPVVELPQTAPEASIYDALVMGTRDYMRKCGFKSALLGLSGGIDSALTACIAADALGPSHVLGVTMPSRYSSEGSADDSATLAKNLGIEFRTIPIEPVFAPFLSSLTPHFEGKQPDSTEENIQARIRGTILMALSNKTGALLLTTGNKSEMAVGYCTLYGDMNGGLAVISDLPKTMVYRVANYVNREREVIPRDTITKPPSAELRPDQKDQDTLPPYEILDGILALLVEESKGRDEVVAAGFDPAVVDWVARAVRINEYKRRQAATGLRVTPKAFGSGRRFPIAARYEL